MILGWILFIFSMVTIDLVFKKIYKNQDFPTKGSFFTLIIPILWKKKIKTMNLFLVNIINWLNFFNRIKYGPMVDFFSIFLWLY